MINDLLNTEPVPEIIDVEHEEIDPNQDYIYATDDIDPDDTLDEFLEDIQQQKEETGANEEPDIEELREATDEEVSKFAAENTAIFINDMIDEVAAHGLAWYAHEDVDKYRAGKEQKKKLKALWTKYMQEKQIELKIEYQIIISMVIIYGAKFPGARDKRKLYQERLQLEEDRKRLEQDRNILNEERERLRRKKNDD